MSDELARWLGAQLDTDATRATSAGGDAWRRQDHPSETVAVYDSKGEPVVYDEGSPTEEQQAHIVEWDPARVLREIDAKRRIVAEIVPAMNEMDEQIHGEWGSSYDPIDYESETLLRLLALPYADRPGYREEWRP
ncbi:DUF6221 family protein [Streptomyces sp. NPDC003007]